MGRYFITSRTSEYFWQNECRAMPRGEGERICRFCEKLLNSPEEIRVPVVAVFNTLKTKNCSGTANITLKNYPQLSCLSCARQVARLTYSCSTITSRCNELLEKLENSPECFTPPSCAQTIFSALSVGKRT